MNPVQLHYEEQQQDRQARALALDLLHRRIADARTLAFLALLGVLAAVIARQLSADWVLVCLVLLLALVIWHQSVEGRWRAVQRALQFYQSGLSRLAGQPAKEPAGTHYLQDDHLYQSDLDLFGPQTLYPLICRARTRPGQDLLAAWLTQPASAEEILERQAAVQELLPRWELREQVATLELGSKPLTSSRLRHWAGQPTRPLPWGWRLLSLALGLAGLAALLWALLHNQPLPLLLVWGLQKQMWLGPARGLSQSIRDSDSLVGEVPQLRPVLQVLQELSFDSPRLARLWRALQPPPAQALAQLQATLEGLASRRNLLLAPLLSLSLASLHWAHGLERWRMTWGGAVEGWLQALGEFEALSSLACLAYEHPDYTFPCLEPAGFGLVAHQLAHPLLRDGVANDLDLRTTQLWVISGSNMAGKSSLLRALGVNVVLAMAGGPTRCRSLHLEPLQLGCSIRIQDSLQGGVSRFYAEILGLGRLLKRAQGTPRLLFLLDEVMSGTNSHDRLLGAQALVKALLERGAIGLVTTHDLALTDLVENWGERAGNLHLREHFEQGTMSFDYLLRPGPVQGSNALEFLRQIGLDP